MSSRCFEITHAAVAGRTRLRGAALRHEPVLALELTDAALDLPQVHDACAEPRTGSLLLWHSADLDRCALLRDLDQLLARLGGEAQPRGSGAHAEESRPPTGSGSASQQAPAWHSLDAEHTLAEVSSRVQGLLDTEARGRLQHYGENALPAPPRRSDIAILAAQLRSPPVAMLGASAAISIASGGLLDAAAIGAVVAINSVIGFLTERQSERTIAAMGAVEATRARVLRAGEERAVAHTHVVPGDVLLLSPGARVAADARLLSAEHLSIDEAPLTGESMPVGKCADTILPQETVLAERCNLVHMGTNVSGGSGRAVVVATGPATEIGQVQSMVTQAEVPATPVQRQLQVLGNRLAWISAGICGGVFVLGVLRGRRTVQMLQSAVSLAVAAVPEGLPAVATTTLALGIRDMRRRHVQVRRLDAVETLGAVQDLCLDKTGTLTENRMALVALRTGAASMGEVAEARDAATRLRLLETVCLCSEVTSGEDGAPLGSATEVALVQAAAGAGVQLAKLRERWPRQALRQRALEHPYLVSSHRGPGQRVLTAVKGSPEEVLALCRYYQRGDRRRPLDQIRRDRIREDNAALAGRALRVLGVARALDNGGAPLATDRGLTWLGLVGLADPLRPGMKAFLDRLHRAGVNTLIITGDQSATAYAIARELSLAGNSKPIEILDSTSLDRLDPELLSGVIRKVHVFSRVSPAHKLQIVTALQRGGRVVGMTGDGVNDGPALKAANLGIAMGRSGSDVARATADIVVGDDNLHTLEVALRDGRTVYGNIRKAIRYLVATNLSEIELMLAGVAVLGSPPLTPMQLLWINLITDVAPALALALEPGERDVLERPPRSPDEPILSAADLRVLTAESLLITGASLASYGLGRVRGTAAGGATTAFTTLTVAQLLHAVSSRSEQTSVLRPGSRPPNRHLHYAIGLSLGAQALTLWLPPLRRLLGSSPLGAVRALAAGALGTLPFVAIEAAKMLRQGRAPGAASAASNSHEH